MYLQPPCPSQLLSCLHTQSPSSSTCHCSSLTVTVCCHLEGAYIRHRCHYTYHKARGSLWPHTHTTQLAPGARQTDRRMLRCATTPHAQLRFHTFATHCPSLRFLPTVPCAFPTSLVHTLCCLFPSDCSSLPSFCGLPSYQSLLSSASSRGSGEADMPALLAFSPAALCTGHTGP